MLFRSYSYTPAANTEYEYKFEAWTTEEDGRGLHIQFHDDYINEDWFGWSFYLDNTRTVYTLDTSDIMAFYLEEEGWSRTSDRYLGNLQFHCANQLGTFYVRMISITPLPSP